MELAAVNQIVNPAVTKEKTVENSDIGDLGSHIIQATDLSSDSKLDALKPTRPTSESEKTERVAQEIGIAPSNSVWTALQSVLSREAQGKDRIQKLTGDVKKTLGHVDTLLDLHAELIALPAKESHEVSDKMNQMIRHLREAGIELWPKDEMKISKEKVEALKSHISSHIEKCNTKIKTIMSTEIQMETQDIQSILNAIQEIIRADARTKKHANDNSAK